MLRSCLRCPRVGAKPARVESRDWVQHQQWHDAREGRLRTAIPRAVRRAVLARAGGFCEGCGKPLRAWGYEVHHVNQRAGDHRPENLKVLCAGPNGCHAARHVDGI